MPARKSTSRQTSATPVKATRRASGAADNVSISKRSLRSASQAPAQANAVYPNLPEVQTQQSYAYGSTKAPLLPDQLRPREKMSLGQLAQTVDQQKSEADQHFRGHAAEVETNLLGQSNHLTNRTTRKRPSAGPSPVREGSHDSTHSELGKTQRTAAWASSLNSDHLQNITEEDSDVVDDDNTRHGTDPSSFPSGIFDHSYNYERGLRQPQIVNADSNAVQAFFNDLKEVASGYRQEIARVSRKAATSLSRTCRSAGKATLQALPYIGLMIVGLMITALAMLSMSFIFCALYKRTLCDPASISPIQTSLQQYCGSCLNLSYTLSENLTPEQQADISLMTKALTDLRRRLQEAEKRIDAKLDSKQRFLSSSIEELKERQRDMESIIAKLARKSPSFANSTLENKINYFSPGAGAIINPLKSSPTLQRPPSLIYKGWQLITGRTNYISNPPSTALVSWNELGECWCSAGSSDIRLAVTMGHLIYPTAITIEHIPWSASPDADTAPREIEVWANFNHLSPDEYAERGTWDLVGSNPIAPAMGKVGKIVYETTKSSGENVQTFQLDVNQGDLRHSTREVVVRVTSNYGSSKTCLYRVRLHGVPVVPHPTPTGPDF